MQEGKYPEFKIIYSSCIFQSCKMLSPKQYIWKNKTLANYSLANVLLVAFLRCFERKIELQESVPLGGHPHTPGEGTSVMLGVNL